MVIKELLGEYFNGIIISDFWTAYNQIETLAKQKCIVHLHRELKIISLGNFSEERTDSKKNLNIGLLRQFVVFSKIFIGK